MIRIRDLRLDFPGFTLGPASLHVEAGSFFALMGPTGSGKTLLLESLAGLIKRQQGRIEIAGRDVTALPPERRGLGLVYQDNALFPHMTVLDNIVYGQRYHGVEAAEGKKLALELADMLRISPLLKRRPSGLSGGEKQRTAIARALACRPGVVLLDEPLSSLDPQFREGLRKNLKEVHAATGAVFFMVTHDFTDALTLADHAAVIHKGKIEQAASTLDIFHKPATTFIAEFVGMGNIFPSTYDQGFFRFAGVSAPRPADCAPGREGCVALRPEDVHVSTNGAPPEDWISLPGKVESVTRQGFSWAASVRCGEARFTARLEHRPVLAGEIKEGSSVCVAFDPDVVHYIPDPSS